MVTLSVLVVVPPVHKFVTVAGVTVGVNVMVVVVHEREPAAGKLTVGIGSTVTLTDALDVQPVEVFVVVTV